MVPAVGKEPESLPKLLIKISGQRQMCAIFYLWHFVGLKPERGRKNRGEVLGCFLPCPLKTTG